MGSYLEENASDNLLGPLISVRRGLFERINWRFVSKDLMWNI
jgi:hypothetical protein